MLMHLKRRIPSHLVDICSHFYYCHRFFLKIVGICSASKKIVKNTRATGEWRVLIGCSVLGVTRHT